MRVMLINPPVLNGNPIVREGRCMQRKGAWTSLWPPLTLATLASLLREKGFSVLARDYVAEALTVDNVLNDTKAFKPDMLVLNTVAASLYNDLDVANNIKSVNRSIFATAIGLQASGVPDSLLVSPFAVDAAIVGEPDIPVARIADVLSVNGNLNEVEGIAYRKDGCTVNTGRVSEFIDIDSLPMPAWEFFNLRNYTLPFSRKPFLLVTTARGCPHTCEFCPIWIYYGRVPRLRSPERIADEIEYDIEKFGVRDFLFWAESFTLNEIHVAGICEEILRRNLKINWMCNSRVDNVNDQMLRLMKRAGCWLIGFGIESGSQRILDSTRKGISLDQIRRTVKMSHSAGIVVVGHVIIGLPHDDERSINETINFTRDVGLDFAQFYCAVPFPGSKLYDDARNNGWLKTGDWTMFEQNRSIVDYPELSSGKIEKLRRRAIRSFYLRPASVWKLMKLVKTRGDMRSLFYSVREFLSWL